MPFAQRLQAAMSEKAVSRYRLSKMTDVHQTTISNWLNGKSEPRADMIQRIAEELEIPVGALLYDGNITIDTTGAKKPENMTPEELNEYISALPKTLEQVYKAISDTGDRLLDINAEYDDLILLYYHELNRRGRKEAIKRTRELTLVPEYTEIDAPDDTQP